MPFLQSSWKYILLFTLLLMGGYALYYSNSMGSKLSSMWQNAVAKSKPNSPPPTFHTVYYTSKPNMGEQRISTPTTIGIPDLITNKTEERQQTLLLSTSSHARLPSLNSSLAYATQLHTAGLPTNNTMEVPKATLFSIKNYQGQLGTQNTHTSASSTFPSTETGTTLSVGTYHCNVSGIKSWEQGVVTQLLPPIKRDCSGLVAGSQGEVYKVRKQLKNWKNEESDAQFLLRMSNCKNVVEEFSNNFYVSREEENFPLAFTFVVYTNARQVVRLLKAIYRPHNLYCIHPDARQGEKFAQIFRQISKCLDNVFFPSKIEKVYYAHHSIMDAQLNCLRDLVRYPITRWKYAINICGREVPLKTNREIVSRLKELNGSSALGDARHMAPYFWRQRFQYKTVLTGKGIQKTNSRLGPVPYGIRIYKSLTFLAASRKFASYILSSKKAIALRNYLRTVYIPEEHFYASLYLLPEAPGGRPVNRSIKVPVVSKAIWLSSRWAQDHKSQLCHGWEVHALCVLSCYDLHTIFKYGGDSFFFNKYFMERDHTVMDCAEERLVQRNLLEYRNDCS